MIFAGKKVLVFGTGKSGIAAEELLHKKGASVVLYDGNDKLEKEEILKKLESRDSVEVVLGELPEEMLDSLDLVVLSPGVPTDLPVVLKMKEKEIPVIGEVELAYQVSRGKVLAITGTNGKTTTTSLLGEIMKAYQPEVKVVGNIGTPYTSAALDTTDDTVTVAEISSFQLETIKEFHPAASAITNITEDHLNRHHTMECYTETKARVAMNQTKEQMCVLNYEDERLQQVAKNMSADVFWFSSARELERGIFLRGEEIVCRDGEEITLCNIHDLKLLGMHNYENVMAAAAIAHGMNVPWDVIRKVVCEFQAVPHRIEFVKEVNGVKVVKAVIPMSADIVKDIAFQLKGEIPANLFVVIGSVDNNKPMLTVMISDDLVKAGQNAGKLVREAAKLIQGGGGGQPHFATAGGKNADGLNTAVDKVIELAAL